MLVFAWEACENCHDRDWKTHFAAIITIPLCLTIWNSPLTSNENSEYYTIVELRRTIKKGKQNNLLFPPHAYPCMLLYDQHAI